jgi:hypothetical protein
MNTGSFGKSLFHFCEKRPNCLPMRPRHLHSLQEWAFLQLVRSVKSKEKFYFTFFFLAVLCFELRAYTLSHSTGPFFVMGFFEIGSRVLFASG